MSLVRHVADNVTPDISVKRSRDQNLLRKTRSQFERRRGRRLAMLPAPVMCGIPLKLQRGRSTAQRLTAWRSVGEIICASASWLRARRDPDRQAVGVNVILIEQTRSTHSR